MSHISLLPLFVRAPASEPTHRNTTNQSESEGAGFPHQSMFVAEPSNARTMIGNAALASPTDRRSSVPPCSEHATSLLLPSLSRSRRPGSWRCRQRQGLRRTKGVGPHGSWRRPRPAPTSRRNNFSPEKDLSRPLKTQGLRSLRSPHPPPIALFPRAAGADSGHEPVGVHAAGDPLLGAVNDVVLLRCVQVGRGAQRRDVAARKGLATRAGRAGNPRSDEGRGDRMSLQGVRVHQRARPARRRNTTSVVRRATASTQRREVAREESRSAATQATDGNRRASLMARTAVCSPAKIFGRHISFIQSSPRKGGCLGNGGTGQVQRWALKGALKGCDQFWSGV